MPLSPDEDVQQAHQFLQDSEQANHAAVLKAVNDKHSAAAP